MDGIDMSRGGVGGRRWISQFLSPYLSCFFFFLSSFVRILVTKAGGSLNTRGMEILRKYL